MSKDLFGVVLALAKWQVPTQTRKRNLQLSHITIQLKVIQVFGIFMSGKLKRYLARKLKARWIEREKIKSKWRAEKRRDPSLRQQQLEHVVEQGNSEQVSVGAREEEEEEWPGIQPSPQRDQFTVSAARMEQKALARKAYSPTSLHYHKSHPNKKKPWRRKDEKSSGGQPNMKLRMNALLDRIKRNM
jgi:hypothetical protein